MQYDHIVIRYGELSLKGRNRKIFTHQLETNVKKALRGYPNVQIKTQRDRMYVKLNGENGEAVLERCTTIFGIQNMSLAIKVKNDLEEIKEQALRLLNETEGVRTFKISTKRSNKNFPIKSQELNHILGSHLLINT